jgi:FkbM family methyltransferase
MANGTRLYLDLSQRMCHGLFFLRGQPHEYGTEKILRALLRAGDTFVDVGANVGYYSVMAGAIVGPSGMVFAIEPQPTALSVLTLNAQAPDFNICVVPVAASDHTGTADFWVRPHGDRSSLGASGDARHVSVGVDTLDRICSTLTRVSMMKLDVEGFELDVLRGATRIISRHRPLVCFELLEEMICRRQVDVREFAAFFHELDYSCYWIDHSDSPALVAHERSTYVLATPSECASQLGPLPPAAF